jgi:pimeloyl-ACP methyl ester carboxylesterase
MKDRLKYLFWGFVLGAVLTMIVGFSWGGWTTGSTAQKMAQDRADAAVVAALTPACVELFMKQPDAAAKLAALKQTSAWEQASFVEKGGWATVAGAKSPNSGVARGCAEALAKIS